MEVRFTSCSSLTSFLESPRPRRVAVIVNPYSGNQTGPSTWAQVAPMFTVAGITVSHFETEDASSAAKIVMELDISTIDAIVW